MSKSSALSIVIAAVFLIGACAASKSRLDDGGASDATSTSAVRTVGSGDACASREEECPAVRPRLGSPCGLPSLRCGYADGGTKLECRCVVSLQDDNSTARPPIALWMCAAPDGGAGD